MEQEIKPAYNNYLEKAVVQWFIEHSNSHQLWCWLDILVLLNPLLRKVPKRWWQADKSHFKQVNLS